VGQASIPVLNRNGYTMFWSSVWDNKHNYSKLLKEDLFLRDLIIGILTEKLSSKSLFLTKNFIKVNTSFLKKHYSNVLVNSTVNYLSSFLFKLSRVSSFFSKVYIIRLNAWIIIYMYSYTPTLFKSKVKINSNNFKHVFMYYHKSNLIKNELNKLIFFKF
jgi:hypothetical protein